MVFDLSAYVAPGLVLATMLIAFVAFAVWGTRAIRESAEQSERSLDRAAEVVAEEGIAPVVEAPAEQTELDLLTENPATDLEHTAEFSQPSFAQSFLEGEEIDSGELDFDAAIERITADLDAAEAAEQTPPLAEKELDADLDLDSDIEATRMLQPDEQAAILEEQTADSEEQAADSVEETIVMPKLTEDTIPALSDAGTEMLDKIALEETRTIKQQDDLAAAAAPVFGEDEQPPARKDDGLSPESPIPFGQKIAWLAIPGYKPSEVISALRLGNVEPANWTKGLSEAYADNDQVFVTPTLSGWVLVIGKTLWKKADMNRSAENIQWLKDVGRLFGNACFFSTMRGLGNHGWVGIRGGNIVRAYGYSGELQELIWLLGEPTEEEIAVNPAFAHEMQERREPGFRPVIPDERMVLAMAAGWSVDVSFSNRRYPPDFGFVGTLD